MLKLAFWDWLAIGLYIVVALVVGLVFTRRGGNSLADYFAAGRGAPWWLLGVSMVATTFAADTPLAVTGMVAQNGVAGNWLWWNAVMSGMLTTFLFARLWRRSAVLTDVELTELRYGGSAARALRVFRALYLALPINCIVMGWVTLGMHKVLSVSLGVTDENAWLIIYGLYGLTAFYITLAGLWGVLATDFIQFAIAMGGSIVLAVYALDAVGGVAGLKAGLAQQYGVEAAQNYVRMLPTFDVGALGSYALMTFLVMIAVQWWAAWYPGAEPGGGGYVAQRMLSAKNERHALLAVLLFNLAHYALRPWPWIIVALCALVLYPGITDGSGVPDAERGYPQMMVEHLPPGWLGLMLTAFLAAFMSTIGTQLNWGASYMVNDVYKRVLRPRASEKHYVLVSRLTTVLTMGLALVVSRQMDSVKGAWELILSLGAGTGLVYILRWYWSRVNAWSEIVAMLASLAIATPLLLLRGEDGSLRFDFAERMLLTVGGTTLCWLIATFATLPERNETLTRFYRRVHPGGPGWRSVRSLVPDVTPDTGLGVDIACAVIGVVLIYSALFSVGQLIFGSGAHALVLIGVTLAAFVALVWLLNRRRAAEDLEDRPR